MDTTEGQVTPLAISTDDEELAKRARVLGKHLLALAACLLDGQGDRKVVLSRTHVTPNRDPPKTQGTPGDSDYVSEKLRFDFKKFSAPIAGGLRGTLTIRRKLQALVDACDTAPTLQPLDIEETAEKLANMRANLMESYRQCKEIYNQNKRRAPWRKEPKKLLATIHAAFEGLLRESLWPYAVKEPIRAAAFGALDKVLEPKLNEKNEAKPGQDNHMMPSDAATEALRAVVQAYFRDCSARFIERDATEVAGVCLVAPMIDQQLSVLQRTLEVLRQRRKT